MGEVKKKTSKEKKKKRGFLFNFYFTKMMGIWSFAFKRKDNSHVCSPHFFFLLQKETVKKKGKKISLFSLSLSLNYFEKKKIGFSLSFYLQRFFSWSYA